MLLSSITNDTERDSNQYPYDLHHHIVTNVSHVFVCFFPITSETVNPNEQKFCGKIFLGVKMVLG